MMFRSLLPVMTLSCGIFLSVSSTLQAVSIIINREASFTNDDAYDAFVRAADTWSSQFTDDITINITADFRSFGNSTTLGSTSNVSLFADYDTVANQLRISADADDTIHPYIPTAAQFNAATSATDSISSNLRATKANLKALGVTGLDANFGSNDGNISFNSDFTFDFDNSDGVSSGAYDFEVIALHEIGHVLGFVSVVDTFDQIEGTADPYIFDLFRLGDGDPAITGSAFTTAERQLTPGETSYFSDGETQILLSTGVTEGDGRQASHFKDSQGLGILDPTLAPGETGSLTENDLAVFDAIGYDRIKPSVAAVPEPSATFLLGISSLGLLVRRRKA